MKLKWLRKIWEDQDGGCCQSQLDEFEGFVGLRSPFELVFLDTVSYGCHDATKVRDETPIEGC